LVSIMLNERVCHSKHLILQKRGITSLSAILLRAGALRRTGPSPGQTRDMIADRARTEARWIGSDTRVKQRFRRHCEERSDEAIQSLTRGSGLLRFARNDEVTHLSILATQLPE
jgi:hypothetical protein